MGFSFGGGGGITQFNFGGMGGGSGFGGAGFGHGAGGHRGRQRQRQRQPAGKGLEFKSGTHVEDMTEELFAKAKQKSSRKIYLVLFYSSRANYNGLGITGEKFEKATSNINFVINVQKVDCRKEGEMCKAEGFKPENVQKKPEIAAYASGRKRTFHKRFERMNEDTLAEFVGKSMKSKVKSVGNVAALKGRGPCGQATGDWGTCLLFVDGDGKGYRGTLKFMFDAFAHKYEGKVNFAVGRGSGGGNASQVIAYCGEAEVGSFSLDVSNLKRKKTPLSLASKFGTFIMTFYGGKKCKVEL